MHSTSVHIKLPSKLAGLVLQAVKVWASSVFESQPEKGGKKGENFFCVSFLFVRSIFAGSNDHSIQGVQ